VTGLDLDRAKRETSKGSVRRLNKYTQNHTHTPHMIFESSANLKNSAHAPFHVILLN
jgi:hypothetical protein